MVLTIKDVELPPEMEAEARRLGLLIVNVICDREDAELHDGGARSFLAMVPALPRAGDAIRLQDDRLCVVQRAFFTEERINGLIALVPNIHAVFVEDQP